MPEITPRKHAAALAMLALATAAAGALAGGCSPGLLPSENGDKPPAPQVLRAAPWKIVYRPVGGPARRPARARRTVARQRPALTRTVRRLFDTLLLRREDLGRRLGALTEPGVARTLRRSGAGLPADARRIVLRRRRAVLSVDPAGAARAAGRVRIVAVARVRGRRVAFKQIADLYLRRGPRRWKVFALELDQRPLRGLSRPDREGRRPRAERKRHGRRPEREAGGARRDQRRAAPRRARGGRR